MNINILNAISWAWEYRTAMLPTLGPAATFALLAGTIVKRLIEKTPTGNPEEVTDEMVQQLKDNWRGELPSSSELGFEDAAEDSAIEPDEE